jgi:hypothetical protein
MLHQLILPPPNPPLDTNNPPFANLSSVVASISAVKVMVMLVVMALTNLTWVAKETPPMPLTMS